MSNILFLEERRREIIKQIGQKGRVSVGELSQQFNVSEVTIRADLQALENLNLLVRTYGGAVPGSRGLYDLSLAKRRQQQVSEKDRIGKAGAAIISNGDAIFLDTSSTALAIAQHLKNHHDLTVISNSLAVAQEMLAAPGVTVVMPGGTLSRDTASLIGIDGLQMLHKHNIHKGFFGAHGISLDEGLTDVSPAEAEIKRLFVSMCHQVMAVLDATKWGRVGIASFAAVNEVNLIITDISAPTDMVEQVRAAKVEVILV